MTRLHGGVSRAASLLILLSMALVAGAPASAEPPPEPAKLSLLTLQPALSPIADYAGASWRTGACLLCFGRLGSARQSLYERGVALDASLIQYPQGVVSGGLDETWAYGGNLDYSLSLDSGRLGLWPGGLLTLHGRTKFGRSVLPQAGVLSPVNFNWLTPSPANASETFLEEYYVFQGVTDWLMLVAGRLLFGNVGDTNRFAGNAETQFMNSSLKNSPLLGVLAGALSLHGASLMIVPNSHVTISPFALSRNDVDGVYGSPGGLFSEFSVGAQLTFSWEILGLTGEILPIGGYSSKNVTALDNPYLVGQSIAGIQVATKKGNWVVGFSADQYLYQPERNDPEEIETAAFESEPEGIGVFLRFHFAPKDRNPWNIFASGGIGGRGVIPTRPLDRYGVGFYAMFVSSDLESQPLLPGKLETEWGVEVFYNLALTPWLQLGPSVQYIQSGLPTVDDSVVVSTRLQLIF